MSSYHSENTSYAVEATGLLKHFGTTKAVDGVDLVIPKGSVYGFLGPNGAGKTTTLRILSTLIRPDAGSARIFGHDILKEADAVRSRVSLTGQFASVDDDLSGLENLILIARLLGYKHKQALTRAMELMQAFGLEEAVHKQVKRYSGGMRRRIDIAASIIVTPDLLFLDEPTTGLDPRSRNQVWDIVRELVKAGTTVLLTTQYLDEADQLANRIAVFDHGRIIAEGTSSDLKSSVGNGSLSVTVHNPDQRKKAIMILEKELKSGFEISNDPDTVTAKVSDAAIAARVLDQLIRAGITISRFSLGQPSLDEVFLTLTGRSAGESAPDNSNILSENKEST